MNISTNQFVAEGNATLVAREKMTFRITEREQRAGSTVNETSHRLKDSDVAWNLYMNQERASKQTVLENACI